MNMAMKMVAAYLDAKGIKYKTREERSAIELGFRADNKEGIDLVLFFDDDNGGMAVRSFDYCKFASAKTEAMYKLCSEMNKNYRWIKFYVDESDNTITLADDAVIQLESVGDEAWELIVRMVSIADEAYPSFMKALWS